MSEDEYNQRTGITQTSFKPFEFISRMILGNVRKHSSDFIEREDLIKLKRLSLSSLVVFVVSTLIFYFLTGINISIAIIISFVASISFLFVFGDYIRTAILKRQQEFEETAFLVLNSLSINMISTQSFPHSIDHLISNGISNRYYEDYFKEMIYNFNMGEAEDQILYDGGRIFRNKKYQNAFQNLKNEEKFIESDPDFLLRVKKEIKSIEDNIVIFVAVSCLLPLVLSLVLALIIPPESPSIFVFPLLYALFGTFILRFIHSRSMVESND